MQKLWAHFSRNLLDRCSVDHALPVSHCISSFYFNGVQNAFNVTAVQPKLICMKVTYVRDISDPVQLRFFVILDVVFHINVSPEALI